MVVWKMIFLFQGCTFRFHVNLPGCMVLNHSVEAIWQIPNNSVSRLTFYRKGEWFNLRRRCFNKKRVETTRPYNYLGNSPSDLVCGSVHRLLSKKKARPFLALLSGLVVTLLLAGCGRGSEDAVQMLFSNKWDPIFGGNQKKMAILRHVS